MPAGAECGKVDPRGYDAWLLIKCLRGTTRGIEPNAIFGPMPRAAYADYLPIIALALSAVMAVVSTVTVGGTDVAQSRRMDFAMSIASLAPVG